MIEQLQINGLVLLRFRQPDDCTLTFRSEVFVNCDCMLLAMLCGAFVCCLLTNTISYVGHLCDPENLAGDLRVTN